MHASEPGCRNNPIEILETKAPWRIGDYKLRQDSGGPGKHRGGLGLTRTYEFLSDASALTTVKKTKTKPWGMAGGHDGANGYVQLRPGTDREEITSSIYESVTDGDVLINHSGGGGGWGDPFQRDPGAVLADFLNDYVSLEAARRDYGVVIDPDALVIDEAATVELRAAGVG